MKIDKNFSATITSPIGNLRLMYDDSFLISLDFVDINENCEIHKNNIYLQAMEELNEYFDKKRKIFNIPFKLNGTKYQQNCWNELSKIKYGEMATYKEIAERMGNKNAARSVGSSANKNPIPIIIPCHRVVGSNGKLIGYRGGLTRKEWLLNLEKYL